MPPFCPPNDPVVLVAGFTAPAGPDPDQPLPCRLVDAAVTGVRVAGGTPATVTASSLPAGTIPTPAFRSGVLLPDPAITAAIAALAVEAFFVDPNNAQAIVARGGVTPNDATVVGALGQAMAAGTAQISSVAQPLEASFAFAAWQQAWAPLFLEWEITWFPSVTAQPTGPPEPVGATTRTTPPPRTTSPSTRRTGPSTAATASPSAARNTTPGRAATSGGRPGRPSCRRRPTPAGRS